METSRRWFVSAGGALLSGSLVGCVWSGDERAEGFAAFYTLQDWAEAVAGDELAFENPVPLGRIGHGWEPDISVSTDIAESELFIYLDSPEFGWARTAVETLERDYPDVITVDALEGVELLSIDDNHEHGDEDEHGLDDDDLVYDPHAWLDPRRARTMVDTIAEGIVEVDDENGAHYENRASAYRDRLDDLHAGFEEGLADRQRDVVVLAAHDSFRYLADRYGFQIVTPATISPEASPSPDDIARTLAVIDEHDVDIILYDAFEADDLAQTLLKHSDAEDIRQVTSAEATTAGWLDDGWGYIEQMREINLPAFKAALGTP